jgi:predicted site-specific integrase-resolvase
MTRELTIKEYAAVERVTVRTVQRWIDKGAVLVRRTPGGGVRVLIIGAEDLKPTTKDDSQRHPDR